MNTNQGREQMPNKRESHRAGTAGFNHQWTLMNTIRERELPGDWKGINSKLLERSLFGFLISDQKFGRRSNCSPNSCLFVVIRGCFSTLRILITNTQEWTRML